MVVIVATCCRVVTAAVQIEDGFCFEQIVCYFVFGVLPVQVTSLSMDLFYVFVSGYAFRRLVCLVSFFYVLF